MSKFTSCLLLSLATVTAHAENLGFRVVIESAQQQRAIIEVSSPQGLSYRLCSDVAPSLDAAVLCPPLGEDLPNTAEAKDILDKRFAAEMSEIVTTEENAAQPLRLALLSVRDGVLFTGAQILATSVIPRAGNILPGRKVLALSFAGWTAGSAVLHSALDLTRVERARQLRPFADPGASAGLAQTRELETQRSVIFNEGREMDFIVRAMVKAVATTNAAFSAHGQ